MFIRASTYPKGIEETFALIGFGLGRTQQLDDHIGQIPPPPGGSAESIESRPHLHLLYSGRKRLHTSTDVTGLEGLVY